MRGPGGEWRGKGAAASGWGLVRAGSPAMGVLPPEQTAFLVGKELMGKAGDCH